MHPLHHDRGIALLLLGLGLLAYLQWSDTLKELRHLDPRRFHVLTFGWAVAATAIILFIGILEYAYARQPLFLRIALALSVLDIIYLLYGLRQPTYQGSR